MMFTKRNITVTMHRVTAVTCERLKSLLRKKKKIIVKFFFFFYTHTIKYLIKVYA